MANERCCVALFVLIVCTFAYAAVYTSLPAVSVNPCAQTLSRALLAVTGLDPYVVSCAADDGVSTPPPPPPPPLSDGGHDKINAGRVGGPIVTDLLQCRKPEGPDFPEDLQCCPPMPTSEPIDFTLPDPSEPLRTRRPAHVAGAEYMAKYKRAIALMKALSRSDPRSFYQQANIHCAYCTGAYVGHPELAVQVHFSWLFFPFHRAYIYFFERIAGKLLGDPGFAVPFWSWDVPEGMRMPLQFANASSPLYDPMRNPWHAPPKLVDLDYTMDVVENNYTDDEQIKHNLWIMYKQMIRSAPLASLFHGQPFRAGETDKPGAGTVKLQPHNLMHAWVGDLLSYPNAEDMGAYYAAGRDPIFYTHHANIDRLWDAKTLRTLIGSTPHAFLFYDEEARLVRITARDVLDMDKLRYTYHGVGLPWLDARPPTTPNVKYRVKNRIEKPVMFPVTLDNVVTAEVRRPLILWRQPKRATQEEVLVVEHIQTDGICKFDVFVNAREHKKIKPCGREMVGSFLCLRHHNTQNNVTRRGDLGAEQDESVTVTLVPRHGKVRIGGVRIEYNGM
uniref:Tyrosinase copper-binding domain-containing protein n=1 Tax=Oryza nivara TaxID=4536 RepID=A0A0E0FUB6_ORYNI